MAAVDGRSSRWELAALGAVVALGAVALGIGWSVFWFLTDDAYIAFRYVSNSLLGHGYVWNASPFLPVEGYTSFLWLALLEGVWRLTGVEPPDSANRLSLLFALATLLLSAGWVWRMRLVPHLRRWRVALVVWLFAYLLLNRTFLAWTSSGLETAMFNFFLLVWLLVLLSRLHSVAQIAWAAMASAALALTRPDGLLFAAAFAGVAVLRTRSEPDAGRARRLLLPSALAFAAIGVHQVWRLAFYGEWLPNTFYAKVDGIWPESGLRYAFCFVVEYGLWFDAAVVAWSFRAAAKVAGADQRGPVASAMGDSGGDRAVRAVALATVALHVGFYTLIVGGDHFEYRVYSHLLPLGCLALLWALGRVAERPAAASVLLSVALAVSLPVPWTHWWLTKDLDSRAQTAFLEVPLAPHWPSALRWYVRPFDTAQAWLVEHNVGMRHQEHKRFWLSLLERLPSRAEGAKISPAGFPVLAVDTVGVASWVLPQVNILDAFGLNDHVIARTPVYPGSPRRMAHSHQPPAGYLESFRPNVTLRAGRAEVEERTPPLDAEEIRSLELAWRRWVVAERDD